MHKVEDNNEEESSSMRSTNQTTRRRRIMSSMMMMSTSSRRRISTSSMRRRRKTNSRTSLMLWSVSASHRRYGSGAMLSKPLLWHRSHHNGMEECCNTGAISAALPRCRDTGAIMAVWVCGT